MESLGLMSNRNLATLAQSKNVFFAHVLPYPLTDDPTNLKRAENAKLFLPASSRARSSPTPSLKA